MKKIEDYKGQKIAIHFPTYELWLRRKEINPSDTCGNTWDEQDKKNGVYYSPNNNGICISLEDIHHYTILPATDFLEEEFIYGQEYEFSDCEDFEKIKIYKFGCMYPNNCDHDYKYLAFDNKGYSSGFKYARKINTERAEAITTIKELVSKFSINQNEVF